MIAASMMQISFLHHAEAEPLYQNSVLKSMRSCQATAGENSPAFYALRFFPGGGMMLLSQWMERPERP
jgi:hypothetical protein